jgi:hypothetical protein
MLTLSGLESFPWFLPIGRFFLPCFLGAGAERQANENYTGRMCKFYLTGEGICNNMKQNIRPLVKADWGEGYVC